MEEQPTSDIDTDAEDEERGGFGSLGSIVFLLTLTWAAGIASFPLNDNSFFTHLATGRIILDEGRVPSTDPYTFTAAGEPWTVQSWLASVIYAGAEQLGGDVGLRLLVLAIFLVATAVLWRLTRPAQSIVARLLIVTASLFVVTDLWSERPYMAGVIGLGIVWLAMEGAIRPWLLVPLLWVWANAHGSFPLAIVLAASLAGGAWMDRRWGDRTTPHDQWENEAETHRRVLIALVVGTVVAAVSPLGARLLLFPFTALSRSDVFAEIVEWRSPTFTSFAERAFLAFALAVVVLLTRQRSWRLTIPTVVFVGAAIFAQRNVVLATIVLVAVGARSVPRIGTLTARTRPSAGPVLSALLTGLLALVSLAALVAPLTGLGGYPARALGWLGPAGEGLDDHSTRVATQLSTGNLLEVLDGPTGAVFVDDRVDMLPTDVFEGYLRLSRGEPGWQQVLDDYGIDVVVWERSEPAGSLIATSTEWRVGYTDTSWVVACRRDTCSLREDQQPG